MTRVGDIDVLPLVDAGGETHLFVPPGIREAETTFRLPFGVSRTIRRQLLRDRLRRVVSAVFLWAANATFVDVRPDGDNPIYLSDKGFVGLTVFPFTLTAIALGLHLFGPLGVVIGLLGGPVVGFFGGAVIEEAFARMAKAGQGDFVS